jgi:hypothetical protein
MNIGSLTPGTAFRMDWRENERNVGELLKLGPGSAYVRIPDTEGEKWETTHWSLDTEVEPVPIEQLRTQSLGNGSNRERSTVESPVKLVHRLCNELKGNREKVIEAAVAQGVNLNTAKTQFYRWRKENVG